MKNLIYSNFRHGNLTIRYRNWVEFDLHGVVDDPISIHIKACRVVIYGCLGMHQNIVPYSPHRGETKVQS